MTAGMTTPWRAAPPKRYPKTKHCLECGHMAARHFMAGRPHAIAFLRPARGYGTGWETGLEKGYGTPMACGSPIGSKTPFPSFGTQPYVRTQIRLVPTHSIHTASGSQTVVKPRGQTMLKPGSQRLAEQRVSSVIVRSSPDSLSFPLSQPPEHALVSCPQPLLALPAPLHLVQSRILLIRLICCMRCL